MGSDPKEDDFDIMISEPLIPLVMKKLAGTFQAKAQKESLIGSNWFYPGEDQLLAEIEEGRILYAQPFWRFSGYFSENSFFDIIVQALPD